MPRTGLNIHKRKDGRWEGRQEVGRKQDGSIKYQSLYGKTYSEVKEKMKAFIKSERPHQSRVSSEITFGDVVMKWLQNSQIKNKGGTINKYHHLIDTHIIPRLGTIKLSEINSFTINSFLKQKLESGRIDGKGGLSPSYVRSIMVIINSSLNYAVAEKLCDPLNSKILKPAETKSEITVMTLETQRKLESVLTIRENPTDLGIYISLYTGLRIGEICALSWDDIDFQRQVIKVNHTIARVKNAEDGQSSTLIVDTPKTKASIREIPISNHLVDALIKSQSVSMSHYVVSNTRNFVSPRTYDYRYHRIIASVGIPNTNYHVLRHTFATRCIEAGVDIKSLSEILGHANVAITLNTYVHSSIDMKRTQLQKLYAFV